jgi:hypothetical protein
MLRSHLTGAFRLAVCYHKRRLGHDIDAKFNRRYDWAKVQRYYDLGNTISECERRFGFARATFMDAAKRGDLATRPQRAPIDTYLVIGRRTNRSHLKQPLCGGPQLLRSEPQGPTAGRGPGGVTDVKEGGSRGGRRV